MKCESNGLVKRYKSRLIAKECAQKYGLDYEETFNPVVRMTTMRMVIALAAHKDWKVWQIDFKNAFLNGKLHEEIYMKKPKGYVHPKYPQYVCKLKKALYGLKQALRAWCERINQYLMNSGFVITHANNSLYVLYTEKDIVITTI